MATFVIMVLFIFVLINKYKRNKKKPLKEIKAFVLLLEFSKRASPRSDNVKGECDWDEITEVEWKE